jgi:filamentous hemagglutinin family protein
LISRGNCMNCTYRLVWSHARQTWIPAAETARSRGKRNNGAVGVVIGAALGLALAVPAWALESGALPSGGTVTAGQATIVATNPARLDINQTSQRAALDWQQFNIGSAAQVNFVQPNANAVALNRIVGNSASEIFGKLTANGQVFLTNPNGVLFGPGAQVDVGGLVATTLGISNADFMAGSNRFANGGNAGAVTNQGGLTAADNGYIALLAPEVHNQGVIRATLGSAVLAAGDKVTLNLDNGSLLSYSIDQGSLQALVDNKQLIQADGGRVFLSAKGADALSTAVVNNNGIIQARTVQNQNGKIVLLGDMVVGQTNVAGTLDASASEAGDGGFIETSAATVKVADGTKVTTRAAHGQTGTWLIDPTDFTISAGNAVQTASGIGADTLSTNLQTTSVNLQTAAAGAEAGDIHLNAGVSWNQNKLTLSAHRNINLNAALNGSGTASLALEYGQGAGAAGNTSTVNVRAPVNLPAGDNFSARLGSDGIAVNYKVITGLGAAGSATSTDLQGISGNLAGNYVLGANIEASATSGWNGGAGFEPLGKDGGTSAFTGIFDGLGHTISGLTINRPGSDYVGLFGYMGNGTIRNLGLLGGSVAGKQSVGGMVGFSNNSTISQAYASGAVSGTDFVGGLVGDNASGTIIQSYATGTVSGRNYIGGLVGNNSFATISQVYATGAVTGASVVGGLVGNNLSLSTLISQAYATGAVSGSGSEIGGLVGKSSSNKITTSYWDSYSTGQANGVGNGSANGITAVTSDPAQSGASNSAFKQSAYADFDFTPGTGTWFMIDGSTRPFLRSEYSTTINNAHQLQLMTLNLGASYTLQSNIDAAATGLGGGVRAGMWSSAGFVPLGGGITPFTGIFDGLGHSISNLSIKPAGSPSYVGLFGSTAPSSEVRNIGLVDVSVAGGDVQVAALIGSNQGKLSNSYATGRVTGATHVGGLVGDNLGTIDGSYFSGSATAGNRLGGLVGVNTGSISNSYSTGTVTSFAAQDLIGGLVGHNSGGTISTSYASANVFNSNTDLLNRHTGSLVGNNSGTVSNSYWDSSASTLPGMDGGTTTGATGLTSTQMTKLASFSSWNIANTGGSGKVWRIYEGYTAPLLTSFMTNLAVTANHVTTTYNGSAFAGSTDYAFGSLTPSQWLPSNSVNASLLLGNAHTNGLARNVGSYTLNSGPYSGQMGYDINFTAGTLTINPAALTLSTSSVSKTYDGGLNAAGAAVVSGGTLFGSDAISGGSFAFLDKNAGTGKSVSVSNVTVNDGNSGNNYAVTYANNTASTIAALGVTVAATGTNRVYDGTTADAVNLASSGILTGDTITFSGTGAFADKHVGTGKAVTVSGITASGADAGNYTFNTTAATTANITPASLQLAASEDNRVYDASTASAGLVTVSGLIAGDTINGLGQSFDSKNVGARSMSVIAGYTIDDGNGGANYTVTRQNADGRITPADLNVTGAVAADKRYDGTPLAAISGAALSGVLGSDQITLHNATQGTFASSQPGNAIAVSTAMSVDGLDAGNYRLRQPADLTAAITAPHNLEPALASLPREPAQESAKDSPSLLDGAEMKLPTDIRVDLQRDSQHVQFVTSNQIN